MKTLILSLCLSVVALAQIPGPDIYSRTANLTASSTDCTLAGACLTFDLRTANDASVGIQISGTWSATVQFEGTLDCSNWFAAGAYAVPGATVSTSAVAVTSTAGNGQWTLATVGYCGVRARVSAFTSGPVVVLFRYTTSGPPAPQTIQTLAAGATNLTAAANASQLTEKGPRWFVNNNATAAGGAQGTIGKAAGASGVRHVVDCIAFSANSSAAVAAANVFVNVRDGASGAGTILWQYSVSFPTAAALGIQEIAPLSFCGLNLVGTAATAMTIEFSASTAGVIQSVNASGFDVQ